MDLIVASSGLSAIAAKQATRVIPIVFLNVSDPVGQGIVASLAYSGANITGVVEDELFQLTAKRMQLLKDAIPQTAKLAVLMNSDSATDQAQWQQLELAASSLKVMLRPVVARRASEFESTFAAIGRDRPDALFVMLSGLNITNRRLIVELAAESRLPVMSAFKEATEVGGLMSYGSNRIDRFRQAAVYVTKILKGAKPSDLPVEQPTKYELVINLKTAKALGLEIPPDAARPRRRGDRVRRREFIALLGGAAAGWPLAARAQQRNGPVRIGLLPLGSSANVYDRSLVEAFQQGLRQVRLIEGRDIILDVVWISGDTDQAVGEVLRRGAELLIPCGSSASVAAKRQTSTIPILFLSVGDPKAMGLVETLPHPGGNATGFSDILADLSGKLVDLARELSKPQTTVDYLWYTAWPDGQNRFHATEQAAQVAGLTLRPKGIADILELDNALAAIKRSGSTTLIVQPSPFTYGQRGPIIASAMKNGLGTIFAFPVAAREGSLIAYGPDYLHMYRRAPFYVDRILKGAKPADLPVEQPTKVELLINLQCAKALGIEMPLSLLVRADELIE